MVFRTEGIAVEVCPLSRSQERGNYRNLLDQPLRLQRFLHLWSRRDARLKRGQDRPLFDIQCNPFSPVEHREQVTIGDGEGIAHQIVLAVELRGEPVEAFA